MNDPAHAAGGMAAHAAARRAFLRAVAGKCGESRAIHRKCGARKKFALIFESPALGYMKQIILLQCVTIFSAFFFYRNTP
ncbi:MAG: hypothetical protein OXE44_15880 [Nitrospinae bacterium]|nr:hypothetical protein [Nitrospinota bacterium]